jgi:DNA-binding LytR/AlgR family response regulator
MTNKIEIQHADGTAMVERGSIAWGKASGAYCIIKLEDGSEHLQSHNLAWLENKLNTCSFLRVHKSWLVNSEFTLNFFVGQNTLKMKCGTAIPVSRRQKKHVQQFLLKSK